MLPCRCARLSAPLRPCLSPTPLLHTHTRARFLCVTTHTHTRARTCRCVPCWIRRRGAACPWRPSTRGSRWVGGAGAGLLVSPPRAPRDNTAPSRHAASPTRPPPVVSRRVHCGVRHRLRREVPQPAVHWRREGRIHKEVDHRTAPRSLSRTPTWGRGGADGDPQADNEPRTVAPMVSCLGRLEGAGGQACACGCCMWVVKVQCVSVCRCGAAGAAGASVLCMLVLRLWLPEPGFGWCGWSQVVIMGGGDNGGK